MSADLPPPGTRVLHIKTQTEGVVEQRARIGLGAPWRAFVRWPSGGGMWVTADEIEVLPTEHPTSTSNLGAEVSDDVA